MHFEEEWERYGEDLQFLNLSLCCGQKSLHIENIPFLGQENSAVSPTVAASVNAEVMLYQLFWK